LTFGASQTWEDVEIPIVDRASGVPGRSRSSSTPRQGADLGSQTTAILWILDAD
jgi:hypothetical protein